MGSVGVRVELLGSIRARRNGEPVRIRGVVGRSVLAKLALARPHSTVVSVDTLIEALWSGDQPADPVANVHTAISRLRRAVGPDAIMVEALVDNPAAAIDRAPDAAQQMWRTTETVGRAELLLAVAIARHRMGHAAIARRHLENLRGRPMVHPVFHDLRRRYSRLRGEAVADRDVVGDGLSGPTETDIERFLLGELGDRVLSDRGT